MKQKIYILGLVTIAVIVVGALLKTNHWPGGGQLLIFGVTMLLFAFLPLALRSHYLTAGNRQHKALYIVGWLTCLVMFGGMLFKVLHWPGAGKALLVALPFPYVVFLPVFLVVTGKDKNFSIHNTVSVLFLLAAVSIFSALVSLNVSKEKIDDSMTLSRNYNRLEAALDDIPAAAGHVSGINVIDELLGTIDDYQRRIFSVEGMSEEEWNNEPWNFPRPEATSIANKALFIEGKNPTYDTGLQAGLGDLVSELQKSAANEELAGKIPLIFDFYETPDNNLVWTQDMFVVSPRVWSLIYLDALETNLKLLRAGM
ncbi:MAG: hypothetical protein MUC30_03355 [Bacteroidales bacterium]|nr:hypothetical protein [Bacteroidales bacterium]